MPPSRPYLSILFVCFSLFTLRADVPGNHGRPTQQLHVLNSLQISGYHFFVDMGLQKSVAQPVNDSMVITLPGGRGAPVEVPIRALRLSDSAWSEPVYFYAFSSGPQRYVRIDSVGRDFKIYFTELEKKGDGLVPEATPGAPITIDDYSKYNWLLAGIATLAVFILLLIWFLRKRENQLASEKS